MRETDKLKYLAYCTFITECVEADITPIFEYCGRDQRIVIDYIDTKLVLTGVRFNNTGTYIQNLRGFLVQFGTSEDNFSLIDVVRTVFTSREKIAEFAKVVNDLRGEEGVVVKFVDGRFVKIKASDYVLKHRALDGLRFEKDVLKLVLENKLDDVLPLVAPDMKKRLETYRESVLDSIAHYDKMVNDTFDLYSFEANGDRKRFAELAKQQPFANLLFAKFSDKDGTVTTHVRKHCSSQTDVDSVRDYISTSWNDTV
jgi:RNA ligase